MARTDRRGPACLRRPHRGAAAGLTLIGDKGFAGRDFEDLVTTGYGMSLVRPDRRDEAPRHQIIGWIRRWIESVNDTLKGQLDLERHGGRTAAGRSARPISQRLLAMAASHWHNWATAPGTHQAVAHRLCQPARHHQCDTHTRRQHTRAEHKRSFSTRRSPRKTPTPRTQAPEQPECQGYQGQT